MCTNNFRVDIGNPQLSMHSIRETSATEDVKHGIDLLRVSVTYSVHCYGYIVLNFSCN